MRRRSILFLRGADLQNITGARDVEVLPPLRTMGWNVGLVATNANDPTDNWLEDVVVHSVQLPRLPFLGPIVANIDAARTVVAVKPDVLVVSPSYSVAGFFAAALLPATTVVADVRSVPIPGNGWLHHLLGTLQLRLAMHLPRLRGVTAITEGTAQVLRARYGLSSRLPLGIWSSAADTGAFNPSVEPIERSMLGLSQRFTFVYHGHISLLRGVGTLLEALALLRRRHDAGLLLLGNGQDLSRLRVIARDLGVDAVVHFAPTVAAGEVPRYLAAVDAGVVPLPDLWWWAISSPLKLYEYLAMGLPVVATDIAAHRPLEDAVVLAKPTAEGLATAMAAVATRTAERNPVHPRELSWTRQAQALSAFIESVHGGGRAQGGS